MKSLPYFHWYPADAETDENFSAMSDEEVGFLLRCLNHSWINGSLPADLKALARTRKVNYNHLVKMWLRVGRCFQPSESDPSRLVNKRQEEERAKAVNKSLAASKSVRTRYESSTNVDTNVVRSKDVRSENVALRASESESVSVASCSSDSGTEKSPVLVTPSKARWEVDDQFAAFVSAWREAQPNCLPSEFDDAYRPFLALAFDQRVAAVRGISQRVRTGLWTPAKWQMCGKPAKYLQAEWRRVIPEAVDVPRKQSKGEILMAEMNEWAEEEDRRRAEVNRRAGN
jgi:uncharacterized protein YdaU (DUF1376 family)